MRRHCLVTCLVFLLAAACLPREGRAETYDTCAGFIDTVPATVSTQGVWCLRRDLSTALASGAAITIAANNVTIDCNHFKLGGLAAGDASEASGVYAYQRENATVRNCGIRGFDAGIRIISGAGHLVEDSRLDGNLRIGISICCADDNLVRRNRVFDTGGSTVTSAASGISAHGTIRDNIVASVVAGSGGSARGIYNGADRAVINGNEVDSVVSGLTGATTSYAVYADGDHPVVEDNVVSGLRAGAGGTSIGIHATGRGAHIVGNRLDAGLADATYGIRATGLTSICANNSATRFLTAFSGCEVSSFNLAP